MRRINTHLKDEQIEYLESQNMPRAEFLRRIIDASMARAKGKAFASEFENQIFFKLSSDGERRCLTPCPWGKNSMVGSHSCAFLCRWAEKVDNIRRFVVCNCDELNKGE